MLTRLTPVATLGATASVFLPWFSYS